MTDAVTDADPRSLDDPPARPIFLLTDFGLRDTYVGQMRAVIAGIAPTAPVHDVVHELPPQDLGAGASALEEIGPWLPPGAIVCAVVDPGVGTAREPIAARLRREDGSTLAAVAPDNGLLTPWLETATVVAVVRIEGPAAPSSATFHGRDVFAPAAARLAAGTPLSQLGPARDPDRLVRLARPAPVPIPADPAATPDAASDGASTNAAPGGWRGEVIAVDRFGTLVTNLRRSPHLVGGRWRVELAGRDLGPVRGTFADVDPGAPLALIGSSGRLQIAVRNGDARAALGAGVGTAVSVVRAATDAEPGLPGDPPPEG